MFNPNRTFNCSVDLATSIYSNSKANTTWDYIYPQICKYAKDRGATCTLKDSEKTKTISINTLDITLIPISDTIGLSYRVTEPLAKQILDEAYDDKVLFGLPVEAITVMDDFFPMVAITFMSRKSWTDLTSPEAREFAIRMNMIGGF